MDDVKNQLVKDVAALKQQVAEQLSPARVREIVKDELAADKPPVETTVKRPFGLKSHTPKKS